MSVEARRKFSNVGKELETQTQKLLVLLVQPFQDAVVPAEVNKDYVLSIPHLMLNKAVQMASENVFNKVVGLQDNWMGGGTSCGDAVFMNHMQPTLKKVVKALKDEEWEKAFGFIMGISLFLHRDDMGWMNDNECYMEKAWPKWFKDFSLCWRIVLTKSDKVLGLDCVGALEGGYRPPLIKMLEVVQAEANDILMDINDGYGSDEAEKESRIAIFPLPKRKETIADLAGRKRPATGKENAQPAKKRKAAAPKKMWLPSDPVARNKTLQIIKVRKQEELKELKRLATKPKAKQSSKATNTPKKIGRPKKTAAKIAAEKNVPTPSAEAPQPEILTRSGRKITNVQRY